MGYDENKEIEELKTEVLEINVLELLEVLREDMEDNSPKKIVEGVNELFCMYTDTTRHDTNMATWTRH